MPRILPSVRCWPAVAVVGTVLLALSCHENTGPSHRPTALVIVSGDQQPGVAGLRLPAPITVKVIDAGGDPVESVQVSFAVTAGGGHLSATAFTTGSDGRAFVAWTLGTTAGVANTATAAVPGLAGSPATFSATSVAGVSRRITLISGDSQLGEVGQTLPQPLLVQVVDSFGNPAIGHTVEWFAFTGGGSVAAATSRVDSLGQAGMMWTLGHVLGPASQYAQASIQGVGSVGFVASTELTTGRLLVTAGDQQSGGANLPLEHSLAVQVQAADGAPVDGASVTWHVSAGGGILAVPSAKTTPQGFATAGWTLGNSAGAQTVEASAAGATPAAVTFTATAVIAAPGTITGAVLLADASLPALGVAPPPSGLLTGAAVEGGVRKPDFQKGDMGPGPTLPDLIVTFRPEPLAAPPSGSRVMAAPATARAVADAIRSRVTRWTMSRRIRVTDISPAILAARLRIDHLVKMDSIAAVLRADPAVATVSRDYWIPPPQAAAGWQDLGDTIPNDLNYPNQSWHYAMIGLPSAWAAVTGDPAVLVAVVDNGIRFDHPAIAANLTSDGYDFVSMLQVPSCGGSSVDNAADGDGYDPDPTIPADFMINPNPLCLGGPNSLGGHGLHVAGTIGAVGNDGLGVSGVNWHVRIRPVRVLGLIGGTAFDVAQGVLYAAGLPASDGAGGSVQASSPARIINLSLGGPCPSGGDVIHDAVIAATNGGALVVAAAGNEAASSPSCPAAYPEVLAVSAVGPGGRLASYSNYAGTNGLAAPGGDFTDGDGTSGIFSTTCDFTTNPCTPNYARYFGTSQATPHVSGTAALLLAANPGLSATDLRLRLTTYAVDTGAAGPDVQYGAGIVNARNSLTQTLAPSANLYVRLYDSATGAVAATLPTTPGAAFTFSGLAAGTYYVFAGEDADGDGAIGAPGRRWGAYGGAGTPTPVTVSATTGGTAFFSVGLPVTSEGNNSLGSANVLVAGGYVHGYLSAGDPLDVFRVTIPVAGTYTFATSGWQGAFCRFSVNVNTSLTVADSGGAVLAQNDDVNATANNFCSSITIALPAGTTFVTVTEETDFRGVSRAGRYRLEVRAGP
jgi:subtilisin family serine protease